jgi:hypothetical protein
MIKKILYAYMARDIITPIIVTQKGPKKSDLVHKIRTIGFIIHCVNARAGISPARTLYAIKEGHDIVILAKKTPTLSVYRCL